MQVNTLHARIYRLQFDGLSQSRYKRGEQVTQRKLTGELETDHCLHS
jgi:hypothetical protein